jgi:hypothetical protein
MRDFKCLPHLEEGQRPVSKGSSTIFSSLLEQDPNGFNHHNPRHPSEGWGDADWCTLRRPHPSCQRSLASDGASPAALRLGRAQEWMPACAGMTGHKRTAPHRALLTLFLSSAMPLPSFLSRVRRVRAAAGVGGIGVSRKSATDGLRERAGGPRLRRPRGPGAAGVLEPECLLYRSPCPIFRNFGEGSGKSEAPACQGTPVRAPVRLN